MVTRTFFVHNNNDKNAKGLRMNFTNPVKVIGFFRIEESGKITFDPHDRTSTDIYLNFHLDRIITGTANIGIKIEVADNDDPPHIISFSWVKDDGSGDTDAFNSREIAQINENYFRT